MTRARYTPRPEDWASIVAYVQRKLATEPFWLTDTVQAQDHWRQAKRDLITLQQWCEQWLSAEQWQQLKAAVRAARRRRQRTGDPPVNVTLSRQAWLIISNLARHDQMTLSEWLIERHYQEWLKR